MVPMQSLSFETPSYILKGLPGLLAISGPATLQAWQLTLWYLERALLWLLNYSGYYSNRLRRLSEQVLP